MYVTATKANGTGNGYKLTFTSMGQTYLLSQYKLCKNGYLNLKLTHIVNYIQT